MSRRSTFEAHHDPSATSSNPRGTNERTTMSRCLNFGINSIAATTPIPRGWNLLQSKSPIKTPPTKVSPDNCNELYTNACSLAGHRHRAHLHIAAELEQLLLFNHHPPSNIRAFRVTFAALLVFGCCAFTLAPDADAADSLLPLLAASFIYSR